MAGRGITKLLLDVNGKFEPIAISKGKGDIWTWNLDITNLEESKFGWRLLNKEISFHDAIVKMNNNCIVSKLRAFVVNNRMVWIGKPESACYNDTKEHFLYPCEDSIFCAFVRRNESLSLLTVSSRTAQEFLCADYEYPNKFNGFRRRSRIPLCFRLIEKKFETINI